MGGVQPQLIACEGMFLQWANVMVSRWACDVNGGRCVIVTVIFDDCRNVTVGANVGGSEFV